MTRDPSPLPLAARPELNSNSSYAARDDRHKNELDVAFMAGFRLLKISTTLDLL